MSNMKRLPGIWWVATGKIKKCPVCGRVLTDVQACHDPCPDCGALPDRSDGP